MGALHDLFDEYRDRVAFFIVYIKEAHPEDGWVVTHNREEGIAVSDPSSDQERADVADSCVVRSAIRIPVLVDSMNNTVASAYGGWPDRLYLIGNACRFARHEVRVEVSRRGDMTEVTVADDGPGFPQALLPVAFDRFSRGDSARGRRAGGAGLGLAIAAALVEASGGTISASNDSWSEGALVTVRLPSGG